MTSIANGFAGVTQAEPAMKEFKVRRCFAYGLLSKAMNFGNPAAGRPV
jgi:hypothetical protein